MKATKTFQMWRSVILGVLVHILMLYSVFDIYFISPIYHGMTPHKSQASAPANRLVLIVADGLRAASLFGKDMKSLAPYLSSVIPSGSWGVSHTQVPTESRPRHIAMLGGFNEDPSAVTKGWKSNPVDFDSVFNQSTNSWCWGSPDVVNLFNKDNLPHIHIETYDIRKNDFSGIPNAATALDTWVFDKVEAFLNHQKQFPCTALCDSGNIFFLHLGGLDVAGHHIKPKSAGYLEHVKLVDGLVRDSVEQFEKFFGYDNMTAYIFTADHGMTNWGSHGDGSKHETEVPLVVWGAGVSHNVRRLDVEQMNIAPLLASFIGINIPINSLGIVPLNLINGTTFTKAHIIDANTQQLAEHYLKKHKTMEASTIKWTFRPYSKFKHVTLAENLRLLETLITEEKYSEAIDKAHNVIDLCQKGIKYYSEYYQKVLLFFVTFGFVGWIVYLFIAIIKFKLMVNNAEQIIQLSSRSVKLLNMATSIIYVLLTVVCILVFAQSLPMKYYVYCAFCFTWIAVARNLETVFAFFSVLEQARWVSYLYAAVGYTIGIQILVATFFVRDCMAFLLLYHFWRCYRDRHLYKDLYNWRIDLGTAMVLATCPVVLKLQTMFSYGCLFLSLLFWIDYNINVLKRVLSDGDRKVFIVQFIMSYLAFFNAVCVELTITNKYGLLLVNQIISWTLLVFSPVLPLLMSTKMVNRLTSAIVALITPYTLMAVGYEHLFIHFFVRLILNWSSKESTRNEMSTQNSVISSDQANDRTVKSCFYLLMLLMFSYFGAGHTASINSFDPMWTRCFVTVYRPFTMAGLILIKLMIPFLIVFCGFRSVVVSINGHLYNCFLILLLFCDLMVIQLLYFVKNEGSWLQIGVSLSRYIAVNITTILLILLYQIANALCTTKGTILKTTLTNLTDYVKVKYNSI